MENTGCVNICSLTSTLPVIPYQKLTDLHYLSRGGFGTVFRAQHCDWRTTVAIKCLKLDSPVGERERNCLLKEAEVLHKARFNHIIQIFGVCNEPEFFCIVTEYMNNGSLDQLLHEKNLYPHLEWSLRLRVLYEIALGVNFLHNMSPPLLHHDLKTQNILLDGEFHVKIADFGLSKWRQLSISKTSGSKGPEMGGTVIYMPPEEYEPSKSRRADVKHDMYSDMIGVWSSVQENSSYIKLLTVDYLEYPDCVSIQTVYAIIMWEVLSRRIPFEEAVNPMQIMFSVLRGIRPDTSLDSLPGDIPSREILINLMTCGWTSNPDERPSFLKCLIELEPMLRRFDEVELLEAVLEVMRSKMLQKMGSHPRAPLKIETREKPLDSLKDNNAPWQDTSSASGSGSYSSQEPDRPHFLTISDPLYKDVNTDSMTTPFPDPPKPLVVPSLEDNVQYSQSTQPASKFNIPCKPSIPESPCEPRYQAVSQPFSPPVAQGPAAQWVQARREEIIRQMTEACLNQSLDALLARDLLMREDYELITNKPTRTAKVRQLLDTSDRQSEDFCGVVVQKLQENRQAGLQPFPEMSSASPTPSAPLLTSCLNTHNIF